MKHLRFLAILLALCPAAAFGADFGPSHQLASGEVLRGRFTEDTPLKGIANPLHSEGRFVVAPGHGLIWAVEKPMAMMFIFTNAGMVQIIGGIPLLQQSSQKNPFLAQVTGLLAAALSGDWKTLEPNLAITHNGNAKLWRVKMTPRPTCPLTMPFRAITATGGSNVDNAEVLRPDGLSETFTFSNHSVTPGPLTNAETAAFSRGPL